MLLGRWVVVPLAGYVGVAVEKKGQLETRMAKVFVHFRTCSHNRDLGEMVHGAAEVKPAQMCYRGWWGESNAGWFHRLAVLRA